MMNDDIEQLLGGLTPRGVRSELRPQVLGAVANQLRAEPPSRWLRRAAVAMAASLLLGIVLNVWVNKTVDRRLAQYSGPTPVSGAVAELARAVAEVTDAQTAQRICQQIVVAPPSDNGFAEYNAAVEQLLRELQIVTKDLDHETPQENPQMDGRRPGRAGGDTSGWQRVVRLDYGHTA